MRSEVELGRTCLSHAISIARFCNLNKYQNGEVGTCSPEEGKKMKMKSQCKSES